MRKVLYRVHTSGLLRLSLLLFSFLSLSVHAQEEAAEAAATETSADAGSLCGPGDVANGKKLFNQNCAACHALNRKMTGPALGKVVTRLSEEEGLDCEWMYAWIKNSPGMIASGDDYANKIYAEYNQAAMTAFPTLSDQDINDILAYTENPPAPPPPPDGGDDLVGGDKVAANGISNEIVLAILAFVLAVLVIMLFTVNSTLRKIAAANGMEVQLEEAAKSRKPLWKAFADNQFLVFVSVVAFLLVGAYFVYAYLMQVGVDQGYEPVQPIHYSHRIHAGDNKIECKYCHSSARTSKHSGIPSLNVCMNCHKTIAQVADATLQEGLRDHGVDYNKEIEKLYKAVGWDVTNQKYTGESKPVAWVRIHNLPDFAYFNHSQHVEVAGVECQTCHGPVEEMEIMYQYSPLTMGWCINCHRETNVKLADNEYYKKIHEELSKKYGVEQLTAAQMGGLECGKCHY